MMASKIRAVFILLVEIILIGGCVAPDGMTTPSPTPTTIHSPSIPSPAPLNSPQIFIVSPEFDAGIPAGDITVIVEVYNFRLVEPAQQRNTPGEGHLIYYRDVVPPTVPGRPAFAAPGSYAASTQTSYTWHNVPPDTHTFSVQLVNNDDTPLDPPVVAANDVTAI
ncbi:MAG: hypothetical protein LUO93_03110 [Methanomicrobiales archaeon]|nr:hypothetical protein [Methanomicrobiales archaeon]